jgi:hypothetical protein
MLTITDPVKMKAAAAYNAAADHFDDEALGLWAKYGRRTVERLALQISPTRRRPAALNTPKRSSASATRNESGRSPKIVGSVTSRWQRDERFFVAKHFSRASFPK